MVSYLGLFHKSICEGMNKRRSVNRFHRRDRKTAVVRCLAGGLRMEKSLENRQHGLLKLVTKSVEVFLLRERPNHLETHPRSSLRSLICIVDTGASSRRISSFCADYDRSAIWLVSRLLIMTNQILQACSVLRRVE